jgi:hypothetical protein
MALSHRSDESPEIPSPLPQSVGYGVVVAAGLAFAFGSFLFFLPELYRARANQIGMIGVTAILKKTLHEDNSKAETYDAPPSPNKSSC